jgi:hypothetical protein
MMHGFGTDIRRSFNAKLLGQAIKAPGIDLRYWCSLGTVCTVDPETGDKDFKDKHAIYNDSAGVDVDVELQPLGQPCTCKYAGESAGDVTVFTPIRPGDIVLVECPDGDLFTPVITKILHSRSKRQPTEDGKPIFDNNRMLVYAKTVPIDIRTAGGVRVLLDQDGTATITATAINLGGADATEPLELGQTRNTAETEFLTDASAAIVTLLSACSSGPTSVLTPGLTALQTAVTTFLGKLDTFLSSVSKTK